MPELDGLRFLAIGSVVFYHLLGIISVRQFGKWNPSIYADIWPLNWLTHGHFGVPLFFAISGFIVAVPFASHHLHGSQVMPLRSYYLRRLARLGPPYVLCLCLLFLARVGTGSLSWQDWTHLLASLLYIHTLVFGAGSTVMSLAWSLEVEVQFYLLAPVLCLVYTIPKPSFRRIAILAALVTAAVAVEVLMPAGMDRWNGSPWRMSLLNYLQYFLVGFILADFHLTVWTSSEPAKHRWLWDVVGLFAWIFMWNNVSAGPLGQIVLPLAMFLAYAGAFRGILINRFVRTWWVYTIGGMCYTIYLWHQPIMMTWGKVGLPRIWQTGLSLGVNVAIQFAICGVLVVAGGAILFAFTERPFMQRAWYSSIRLWLRSKIACVDESAPDS